MNKRLVQIKLTLLSALVLFGYNQCGQPYQTEPTELVYSDSSISGSLNSSASVAAFTGSVHTLTTRYCSACHTSGAVQHGNPDPKVAHDSIIDGGKVNFSNIKNSRLVAKLRDENHQCWSGDCGKDAQEMEAAVQFWADEVAKIEIEQVEEPVDIPVFTVDSLAAFQGTVYQLTRQHCVSCHTNQYPQHASANVQLAHDSLLDSANMKINFDNIPASRMVERLRVDRHRCWSDCEENAKEMEAQIGAWFQQMSTPLVGGAGLKTAQANAVGQYIGLGSSAAININIGSGNIQAPFVYEQDYLWAPSGAGNNFTAGAAGTGRASYNFNVQQAGTYAMIGEVSASDGNNNSFFIQIDNNASFDWHTNQTPNFTDQVVTRGAAQANTTFNLSAGAHTLTIMQREDGTKLKSLRFVEASSDGGALPPGTGVMVYDISQMLGVNERVEFRIKIREYDDFSYEVFDPEIVSETVSVEVAGVKLLINDFYNPQHSTYTLARTTTTPQNTIVSPYSMVVLKDRGESLDRISFEFDVLQVSN